MTIEVSIPPANIKEIVQMTINELSPQISNSYPRPIEYFKKLRDEVAIYEIATILRLENKLKRNGTNLVEQRLKELQDKKLLTAVNAHGQRNLFKMSDIYTLFHGGHFDGLV